MYFQSNRCFNNELGHAAINTALLDKLMSDYTFTIAPSCGFEKMTNDGVHVHKQYTILCKSNKCMSNNEIQLTQFNKHKLNIRRL